ncbi:MULTISPECIES: selenium metabolism-associated LysR family transcriptional regulator [Carboxydothermus]|uniref:Transcriptional regulator, LysR family n=2 Tax=Carboxydothermus TaxID=129957 RepID=Q3AEF0_CARHZ|nr:MULTISPECIES: selenium metabolism-associated LysR family transcriptional regulator [Carboxydothermus]ABB14549.1 transcriptional regulator, LysR family [Carboxydothermus hydrogenoformans Z-2901]NYE56501.1 DNA-binding transcriptional LysR family regulator [Carboxydothermus ferrireducens DSM 11255]
MNLNQLEAFCNIVEQGSISKAAKLMHLSQPALSTQIAALENQLQVKLMERTNRGIELTEAGETLLYYAKRICNLVKNLNEEIERLKNLEEEELSIGAASTIGGYALPCSIYIFQEKYESARIKLTIMNTEKVIEALLDRQIDIGLVESNIESNEFISSHLTYDELVLVVPNNNSYKNKEILTLDELRTLPFIIREKGSGIRQTIEKALAEKGLNISDLNIVMEVNSIDAIKVAVESGKGVSLLPRFAVKKELRTGSLKSIKVKDISLLHPFVAITLKNKKRSLLEKKFLAFINSPKERGFC